MIIFIFTVLFAASYLYAMEYVQLYAFSHMKKLNQPNPTGTFLPTHNALCLSDSNGACTLYSPCSSLVKTLDFPSYKHRCPGFDQLNVLHDWTLLEEEDISAKKIMYHQDDRAFIPKKSIYCPQRSKLFIAKNDARCGSLTAHGLKGSNAQDCAICYSMQFQNLNGNSETSDDIALIDNQLVSICSDNKTITLWNIDTNTCNGVFTLNQSPQKIIAISPYAMVTATKEHNPTSNPITLCLFDLRTNQMTNIYPLPERITDMRALTPGKEEHLFLSAGFFDNKVVQWDTRINNKPLREFITNNTMDYIVDITTYNNLIIGISDFGIVYIWDSQSSATQPKQVLRTLIKKFYHINNRMHTATIGPDGTLFILGSKNPTLYTFNLVKK